MLSELREAVESLPPKRRAALADWLQEQPTMSDVLRQALKDAEANGRTINSIATESGIDSAMLYRFRDGKRTLRLDGADKLARALDLVLIPGRADRI